LILTETDHTRERHTGQSVERAVGYPDPAGERAVHTIGLVAHSTGIRAEGVAVDRHDGQVSDCRHARRLSEDLRLDDVEHLVNLNRVAESIGVADLN
jgi:hypothetical protein